MAEHSYPHTPADGVTPDDGSIATDTRWRAYARELMSDGVVKGIGEELRVTAVPNALAVRLGTGAAQVDGFRYENDLAETIPLPPATAARIDRLVARLTVDRTTGRSRVRRVLVPGVPGAGVARALTRNADVWEVDLGQIPVPANVAVLPPFTLQETRFARSERQEAGEPIAEFRFEEMTVPEAVDTQLRIPAAGGIFVGWREVNRYGSGAAGSYVVVPRSGVYEVGLVYRYTRQSGAPADELAAFVEMFRGVGGNRLARIGTSGPPNRDLAAYGQAILQAGDLIVWTCYRSAQTGTYEYALTDAWDSLRGTARFVRPAGGPAV